MNKKKTHLSPLSPTAKITPTRKLPSDFFTPKLSLPTLPLRCPSLTPKEQTHPIKDAMLLTFRGNNSYISLPRLSRQPSKHSVASHSRLPSLTPFNPPQK